MLDDRADTVNRCKRNCIKEPSCLAVEFDYWASSEFVRCWWHDSPETLSLQEPNNATDLFILERCERMCFDVVFLYVHE